MRRHFLTYFLIFWVICTSGVVIFAAHMAQASKTLLDSRSRYARAAIELREARKIRKDGVTIFVQLRDGSVRDIIMPEVSRSLNPDENFEFYRVPTPRQITARALYDIPWNVSNMIDERAIGQFLWQSLGDTLHKPTNAHFLMRGKEVLIADDAPGQAIPRGLLLEQLKQILDTLQSKNIIIASVDIDADLRSAQLIKHAQDAATILAAKGFNISSGDYSWDLSGQSLLNMLTVTKEQLGLSVDEDLLYEYVKSLAHSLVEEPLIEPTFVARGAHLEIKEEGSAGQDIDIHGLALTINSWIKERTSVIPPRRDRTQYVTLSYTTTKPKLSLARLKDLGIRERIGSAVTSFKGSSADRIHNITLGSSRVSGYIVQPNEEFSLVRSIGYAEKENGYKEEYVIKGDRSRKEAGGGLCQVATTFFRAALNAGLKITERHNHRYVVGYYGPGLDAGIYAIDHDFRFVNDYGKPILVQVTTHGTDLTVEFFGTGDGRSSMTTKPLVTDIKPPPPQDFRFSKTIPFGKTECTDHAREGLTSFATTTIRYGNGEISTRVWRSEYSPWPKICLIGTGGLNIYQQDD